MKKEFNVDDKVVCTIGEERIVGMVIGKGLNVKWNEDGSAETEDCKVVSIVVPVKDIELFKDGVE